MAYVIDRSKFDQYLAREAVKNGVNLILGRSAAALNISKGAVRGVIDDYESILETLITIDAEGASGRLLTKSGLKPVDAKHILPAIQYELVDVEVEEESVDLFFGRRYAPNFFAWAIPTGPRSARVGLASNEGNIHQLLDKFVDENFHASTKVDKRTGLIVTSGPIPKTCSHGFIAVGDVAGQTKPTTGGGVVTGGICALVAARATVNAMEKHDTSLKSLSDSYEVEWRKLLVHEFSTMIVARRIYNMISDSTLDELFKMVLRENLTDEIEASGDMDFQSSILLKLAKKPSVMKIMPMVVGDLVKAFLS
jgi:flavin-dependent dehydrogenase